MNDEERDATRGRILDLLTEALNRRNQLAAGAEPFRKAACKAPHDRYAMEIWKTYQEHFHANEEVISALLADLSKLDEQ